MIRILKISLLFLSLVSAKSFAKPEYSIPFKLIDNKIIVNFEIDNVKCLFVYDTGANGIDLDSTFVSNNKINLKDILRKGLTYSSNRFSKTVKYSVARDWYKYTGDLNQGILGGSFFEDYLIEIDYKNQLINLYNPDYVIDTDYQKLNVKKIKNNLNFYNFFTTRLTLKLANNKIINGDFLIDTGSSRNITLINQDLRSKCKNLNIVKVTANNASAHGFNKSEYFQCPAIEFNNVNYDSLIIDNNVDIKKSNELSNYIGILGGKFLKNFKILIDYKNSNIYIKEEIQP